MVNEVNGSWTCPSCGRRFANVNQWHSCGNPALDEILAGHDEGTVAIYRAVEAALAVAGDFRVHPQKTRIAFISRMSFASVKLARRWVDLGFITPEPVDDARIRRIELFGPTSFVHHVRLDAVDDVDDDVRRWLGEARRRGDQETLDPRGHVDPLVGHPLDVLVVPLRSVVTRDGDRFALRVARYATEALATHGRVRVRITGTLHPGRLAPDPDAHLVVFDHDVLGELGFDDGDQVDVTLTAEPPGAG